MKGARGYPTLHALVVVVVVVVVFVVAGWEWVVGGWWCVRLRA